MATSINTNPSTAPIFVQQRPGAAGQAPAAPRDAYAGRVEQDPALNPKLWRQTVGVIPVVKQPVLQQPAPQAAPLSSDPGMDAMQQESDRIRQREEAEVKQAWQRELAGNKEIQSQQQLQRQGQQRWSPERCRQDLAAWNLQNSQMEELAAAVTGYGCSGLADRLASMDTLLNEMDAVAQELDKTVEEKKARELTSKLNMCSQRYKGLLGGLKSQGYRFPSDEEIAQASKGPLPANATKEQKLAALLAHKRERDKSEGLGGKPDPARYQRESQRITNETNNAIALAKDGVAAHHQPKLAQIQARAQQRQAVLDKLKRGEQLTAVEVSQLSSQNYSMPEGPARMLAGARLYPQRGNDGPARIGVFHDKQMLVELFEKGDPKAQTKAEQFLSAASQSLQAAEKAGRKEEAQALREAISDVLAASIGMKGYQLRLPENQPVWNQQTRDLMALGQKLTPERRQALGSMLGRGGQHRTPAQLCATYRNGLEIGDNLLTLKDSRAFLQEGELDDALRLMAQAQKRCGGQCLPQLLSLFKTQGYGSDLLLSLRAASEVGASAFASETGQAKNPQDLKNRLAHLAWARLDDLAVGGKALSDGASLDSLLELASAEHAGSDFLSNPAGGPALFDRLNPQDRARLAARVRVRSYDGETNGLLDLKELASGPVPAERREEALEKIRGLRASEQSSSIGRVAGLQGVCLEASLLADKYFNLGPSGLSQLKQALSELRGCQAEIERMNGLVDMGDPRFNGAEKALQAARTRLVGPIKSISHRVDVQQAKLQEARDRQDMQDALKLRDGMTPDSMRKLVRLAAGKPTASMALEVTVRAGVEVKLPFLSGEVALELGLGAQVEMDESGRYIITLGGRIGGAAKVEGPAGKVGAEAGAGSFVKVSYVFANDDEAARFLHDLLNPSKKVGYAKPQTVDRSGAYAYAEGKFMGAKAKYRTEWENQDTVTPVGWDAGRGQRVHSNVKTQLFSGSLQMTADKPAWGLELKATDVGGSKNPAENGTTLRMAVTVGREGDQFISPLKALMMVVKKSNPEKVAKLGEAKVEAELQKKVKWTQQGEGKIEFQFMTGENLMINKDLNVFQVFENFLDSIGQENSPWVYLNTRVAVESEYGFQSPRARYGVGVVNAFVELQGKLQMRQVLTLDGSLTHSRMLLHDITPGVGLSQTQLKELSDDGLLDGGSLDPTAFKVVLGKMRNDLRHLPQAQGKDAQVDMYLEIVCQSMWLGLKNDGRYKDSFEAFKTWVQLDQVKRVDAWIDQNKLGQASDEQLLKKWNTKG